MAKRASPAATALPLVPRGADWQEVHDAAAGCRACDLWRRGTQTVFGEGSARARVMLVGEQPGNEEDLAGYPFVGPAGKLLDKALEEAGIDRGLAYVTNVVKHLSGSRAANAAFTPSPTTSRSRPACRGCRRRSS